MRGLAITGNARLDTLPAVPTLKEAGLPGVDVTTWFGLWAPKNTPPAVMDRLNAAAGRALSLPDVRRQLEAQGDTLVGSSVSDFSTFVRTEHKYWAGFVQTAGIKVE